MALDVIEVEESCPSKTPRSINDISVGVPVEAAAGNHGCVCFLLDGIEFTKAEVAEGQHVPDAKCIYFEVEAVGFASAEVGAVDDFGKVIALLLEMGELFLLA